MGKVLIIDDEKQILGLLSRIIGLEGYEVLSFQSLFDKSVKTAPFFPQLCIAHSCADDGLPWHRIFRLSDLSVT